MSRLNTGRSSRTALWTAMIRARHVRQDPSPLVLNDTVAERFLPWPLRAMLGNRLLTNLLGDSTLGRLRALEGEVLARSRIVEDALHERLDRGLQQCVVLGAGYDSTALRYGRRRGCRYFEVDHPATQRTKRAILGHLDAPHVEEFSLTYVAVDFARDNLRDALLAAGFEPLLPALVSWLGVVMYLRWEVVLGTLALLRGMLARGSAVYLDVLPTVEASAPGERDLIARLAAFTASRGEPMLGMLDPAALRHAALAQGYSPVTIIDGAALRARFFSHLPERIQPPNSMCMMCLEVP